MSAWLPRSARPFDRDVLGAADAWGAGRAGVALLDRAGLVAERGSRDVALPWASVTKVVSALTVLVAVDRGLVGLDDPAGPPGSTLRHLLAHASGLAFDDTSVISAPARTRIYSNSGFDEAAAVVERAAGTPFAELLKASVLGPIGMSGASLQGRPSEGLRGRSTTSRRSPSSCSCHGRSRRRWLRWGRRSRFRGCVACCPGSASRIRSTGASGSRSGARRRPIGPAPGNSPRTFGHFGGSGTFLWVDPERAWRSWRSPTARSGRGRSARGRRSRTECSRRAYQSPGGS